MGPQLVVRLGRRRSAWEKTNPREIAEVEFMDSATGGFDLKPSVYVLSDRDLVVRARAEHSASFLSPPKPSQGSLEFDSAGATVAEVQTCLGATKFTFTNSVHAEILLRSEDELLALVGKLLAEREARAIPVQGSAVLSYVEAKLAEKDPEWIALIAPTGTEQGEWGKAVSAFGRKREDEAAKRTGRTT